MFGVAALPVIDLLCGICAAWLVKGLLALFWRRYQPLLPGPTPFPIIGNLLDMPRGHPGEHWAKHKDLYGLSNYDILVFELHIFASNRSNQSCLRGRALNHNPK